MADKRVAVVTGANKGIGFETCRKLASNKITVILTARNEKNGTAAVKKLQALGLCDVVFHPLDVKDPASIASLAKFVEFNYKKLDILINNAGENGNAVNLEALPSIIDGGMLQVFDENVDNVKEVSSETYEMAVECLKTNYYGTKRVTEALLPLLQLSKSGRVVNVTSFFGQLQFFYNEKFKAEMSDIENLSVEKIDEILQWFLKDFEDDKLKANGWPLTVAAYKVSKAAVIAYTRIMGKKYPNILINCVHPGYVQTDMSYKTGPMTPEEGARAPVMVAMLPDDGPSGRYFYEMQESTAY
ncbi:short-chain dehydrogenase/reductase 2b-like isoform X2 [Apium graveolens]|uniref:short-chain dehydrogenase/reductase 2b-like isoform X2 n=1 Tax=Apium graveolens TaxID=4045 RepID=UPI003D7BA04B